MVGEEVEAAIDAVRIGRLDPASDAAVESRPQPERQALVGDLLRHHVLEQVRLLDLAVEADEVGRPQLVQLLEDLVERPELRVGARQDRRLEHPSDDARDLQRPARPSDIESIRD